TARRRRPTTSSRPTWSRSATRYAAASSSTASAIAGRARTSATERSPRHELQTARPCAGRFCSVPSPPHVREHVRGRPAVDLEAVLLLVGAERGAGEHAGLAVDLVAIEPERGQPLLHGLDVACLQLRVLAPRRGKRPGAADAVAEMADEQYVE